jgi:hypothetical protein
MSFLEARVSRGGDPYNNKARSGAKNGREDAQQNFSFKIGRNAQSMIT